MVWHSFLVPRAYIRESRNQGVPQEERGLITSPELTLTKKVFKTVGNNYPLSTYAFIIGLENYQPQPKPIKAVRFAEADATAVAKAMEDIGVPSANIQLLSSNQATRTTIESRFKTLIANLSRNDSFFFFFAGHGVSINDENYVTCHDTQRGDLLGTCIPLKFFFTAVRKTNCKQATFFLDCCHSGLPIDDSMRSIADHVSDEEFEKTFKSSEYHIAFASCKSDELSYSALTLSHGIWTHHLLKALRGEEPDALERGRFVTSRSLQSYLAQEVPITVRTSISTPVRQTPCFFGNFTNECIIADVKPLIDAREAAKAGQSVATPQDAAFIGVEYGSIKRLSGFKKWNTVPKEVNSYTERFVRGIGEEEVKEQADKIQAAMRSKLGYGVRGITPSVSGASASLKTNDFDVNINLSQDQDEPETYAIRTEITNFRNPAIVASDEFNQAVGRFVDTLELQLPTKFKLENMIDRLEKSALKDALEIDYDTTLSDVRIKFDDTGVTLRFREGVCEVTTEQKMSPRGLLEAVGETQAVLLQQGSAKVPLLGP